MRQFLLLSAAFSAVIGVLSVTQAAPETKPVNITYTGHDQVKQWQDKRVLVILRSGKELEGTVGSVSGANVELKQLAGKDYYDAVIRIDEIAAYIYKTR